MKKIINHFKECYGLYIFFILIILLGLFFYSLCLHEEYLEKNRDYILTLDSGESISCIDVDFNDDNIVALSKSYITIQINENTYRNVSKTNFYTLETIIIGPQPSYFKWLVGDYDD